MVEWERWKKGMVRCFYARCLRRRLFIYPRGTMPFMSERARTIIVVYNVVVLVQLIV